MTSPLRMTGKKVLPAGNLTTTTNAVYFTFTNSAEAEDTYAYFPERPMNHEAMLACMRCMRA
jgi:hypothetical protein